MAGMTRQFLHVNIHQIAVTESLAAVSAFRHWSVDRHDIFVRSSRQKKKLAILNRFFISVPPTLQRPHKSIPEKVKPFGWLAQCLLFHLSSDHGRGISVAPPLFSKRSQSFNALVLFPNASPCNGLCFISPAFSKKAILIITN
jgi:hypothetical protein